MKKIDNHIFIYPSILLLSLTLQQTLRANGGKNLVLCSLFFMFHATCEQKNYVIILDPAGDAKTTGRSIDNTFERGLTLQYVEQVKAVLEQRIPHVKVIISRFPGDTVHDLQNASLANKLDADLFVTINFYQSQDTKPTVYLYQCLYDNSFAPYQTGLAFNTYTQSYKINRVTTDNLVALCTQTFTQQKYTSLFSFAGPYALPIKALSGIISPSICFEIGLKNNNSWHLFVEPLVEAIGEMIKAMESNT